ncbi:MAG: ribose 5-phosphate isomerase A [Candidatus Thorarchaeota archaeon]|nr:MAG: ribose 5-phosphate isomerase A [Candidatus Thorarchaeota archaeon]
MSALKLVPKKGAMGLGSGSTVAIFAKELGRLESEGKTDIAVVPSSYQAYQLANEYKIPLTNLDLNPELILTVDGADEVDRRLDLIKGGGGAFFQEKIVAAASKKLIIVVDESKLVEQLGAKFPTPVEVLPFSLGFVRRRVGAMGIDSSVREAQGKLGPVVTDNGNFILDLRFSKAIDDPGRTAAELKMVPGVVETGLFAGMTDEVHVGTDAKSYVLRK